LIFPTKSTAPSSSNSEAVLFLLPRFDPKSCILLALLVCGIASSVAAQQGAEKAPAASTPQSGLLRLLPPDSTTEKQIDIGGRKLDYTATAGTLSLYGQEGERTAAVFYTAYTVKNQPNRPITFAFNGGPGAASAYLHLGLVGPRILEFGPDGRSGAAARLRDNPDSWLAFTDLVLIDPVGSGWSRPAKADGGGNFWGVRRDAESLGKVVALYVAQNSRSSSAKYLLGESYGGFRAAKVARTLQRDQGIVVSGIVMVSPFIEGAFQFGGEKLALGAALHFPALVASEMERKGVFNKDKLEEAELFARTDYLTMLAGPPPTGPAAEALYAKIALLTGVPADLVAKSRGFVRDAYLQYLRTSENKVASRYDGGITVDDPFPESGGHGNDPVLDGFSRALAGAFVGYARDELGFKTEMTYTLLSGEVSGRWNWGEDGGRSAVGASDDLRVLLALEPRFRLLIQHGYSDLVTPYGVSRYVLDHLPQIGAPGRAELKLYRGGHMTYFSEESRRAMTADAEAFYRLRQ
jgi:carboxypeptidase C (cathepsin A)